MSSDTSPTAPASDDDLPPSGVGPDVPSQGLTFAGKLDRCFRIMHHPDRGEWHYQEVSDGLKALGATISTSYLWMLRKGTKDNPTLRQIEALAKFFHVPASYFLGSDEEVERIDAQMALVEAMRHPDVRDLALRASSLTPAGMRVIAGVVSQLETTKGMSTSRVKRERRKSS